MRLAFQIATTCVVFLLLQAPVNADVSELPEKSSGCRALYADKADQKDCRSQVYARDKATKAEEKARKKAEREAEKAAKKAKRDADKALKKAERDADKARKKAERDAKKAKRERELAAEKAAIEKSNAENEARIRAANDAREAALITEAATREATGSLPARTSIGRETIAGQCTALEAAIMTSFNEVTMSWVTSNMSENSTWNFVRDEQLLDGLPVIDAVRETCGSPDFADMRAGDISCADTWMKDAQAWCDASEAVRGRYREALIERVTEDEVGNVFGRPSVVHGQNGFLPFSALMTRDERFSLSRMITQSGSADPAKAQDIIDALELKESDFAANDIVLRRIAEMQEYVDLQASKWPSEPRTHDRDDVTHIYPIARKRVKDWNSDATDIDIWLVSPNWNIVRNRYDSIERRYIEGRLRFRLPDEELCHLYRIFVNEPSGGGGRFLKAKDFQLERVRFETCSG